jgi:hypothetical protein
MKEGTVVELGVCDLGECSGRSRLGDEKVPGGLTCATYPEDGVKSFNRRGMCPYQDVRTIKLGKKGGKINPIKASKRK